GEPLPALGANVPRGRQRAGDAFGMIVIGDMQVRGAGRHFGLDLSLSIYYTALALRSTNVVGRCSLVTVQLVKISSFHPLEGQFIDAFCKSPGFCDRILGSHGGG
ncbi:MAG: hypothetical protein ING29_10515, partial [Azospirillum sp.]|nr:hypothetical protein [Azospirillum sp.]